MREQTGSEKSGIKGLDAVHGLQNRMLTNAHRTASKITRTEPPKFNVTSDEIARFSKGA